MNILLLFDGDSKTDLSEYIHAGIGALAREKGHTFIAIELKRNDVPPCLGCFSCFTKHPGVCVHNESFAGIIEQAPHCPFIIFLTPVLFGAFSSAMKNALDRGGLIIKNHKSCRQIIIGYGEDANDEERSTFVDTTARHRGKADIVHPIFGESFEVFFTGSREESDRICETLGRMA